VTGKHFNPFDHRDDNELVELANLPNREFRRLAVSGAFYSPEEVLENQFRIVNSMAEKLQAMLEIYVLFMKNDPDVEIRTSLSLRPWAKTQRAHIERHIRQPNRPDLSEAQLRLGNKIDRFILQIVDTAEALADLLQTPERIRLRREAAEANEQRREERLFNRQLEREERETAEMAPPPVKASKREKRAPTPRCERCKKRPQAVGTLCELCASWGGRR